MRSRAPVIHTRAAAAAVAATTLRFCTQRERLVRARTVHTKHQAHREKQAVYVCACAHLFAPCAHCSRSSSTLGFTAVRVP